MPRSFCLFRFGDSLRADFCVVLNRKRPDERGRGEGEGGRGGCCCEEQGRVRIAFFYNSRAMIAKYSRTELPLTLQIAGQDIRWNGDVRHALKNKTVLI